MDKIINLPGNLVRGAGNAVSGTVSAVASAASGVRRASVSRNSIDKEITVPDKTSITVKVLTHHDFTLL